MFTVASAGVVTRDDRPDEVGSVNEMTLGSSGSENAHEQVC